MTGSYFALLRLGAVLLVPLFRVTGTPATETRAQPTRADHADHQRTTCFLVPLPPRHRVTS
jgi:hypothetical protein